MIHILKIDDFIKESRGAALSARTPDRFNSDPLDKDTNSVYDAQIEKNEKVIKQIGVNAVSRYTWLDCEVVYDDMAYGKPYGTEGLVDLFLYIKYNLDTRIPFSDFGIDIRKCTPAQINYLERIDQIKIDGDSFVFNAKEYEDEFYNFVIDRTIEKGIYTFNYWSNQANMGPTPPDLKDVGIVCMFDDDDRQGSVNKQKMTQLADHAVKLWLEYFNLLFKRVVM